MAEFIKAFKLTIAHEGGYVNDPDDPGGETYKGISRKNFPDWIGWSKIDEFKKWAWPMKRLDDLEDFQEAFESFYRKNFWYKINGDQIENQNIANSIFDFAVNAGVLTSASLAQEIVKVKSDGVIGNDSITAINAFNPDHFLAAFTVAKIARYANIVKKRPTSQKYFYGWVRRALGEN